MFAALDELDERLGSSRYLVGDTPTEADWRLFPTLVRFDTVYYLHFKCNRRRIVDYRNLWDYARDLYQMPRIAETVSTRADQAPLLHDARHDQPEPPRAGRPGHRLPGAARSRVTAPALPLARVRPRWLIPREPPPPGRQLAALGREAGAQARLDASASRGLAKRTVLSERPQRLSDRDGSGPDALDGASGRAWIVESTI